MVDRDVALAKIASIQKWMRRIKEITHLNIAPTAGIKTIPYAYNTPAARGIATTL